MPLGSCAACNAPWELCSTHTAHARVGLRGSLVGPVVVKNDFFQKLFLHLLGSSNKSILSHLGPTCKLQKSLEMGNFGTDSAAHGDSGGMEGAGVIGKGCGRSAAGHASRVSKASKEGF